MLLFVGVRLFSELLSFCTSFVGVPFWLFFCSSFCSSLLLISLLLFSSFFSSSFFSIFSSLFSVFSSFCSVFSSFWGIIFSSNVFKFSSFWSSFKGSTFSALSLEFLFFPSSICCCSLLFLLNLSLGLFKLTVFLLDCDFCTTQFIFNSPSFSWFNSSIAWFIDSDSFPGSFILFLF